MINKFAVALAACVCLVGGAAQAFPSNWLLLKSTDGVGATVYVIPDVTHGPGGERRLWVRLIDAPHSGGESDVTFMEVNCADWSYRELNRATVIGASLDNPILTTAIPTEWDRAPPSTPADAFVTYACTH